MVLHNYFIIPVFLDLIAPFEKQTIATWYFTLLLAQFKILFCKIGSSELVNSSIAIILNNVPLISNRRYTEAKLPQRNITVFQVRFNRDTYT